MVFLKCILCRKNRGQKIPFGNFHFMNFFDWDTFPWMVTILPIKCIWFVLPPWRNPAWPSPKIHSNGPRTHIKKSWDGRKNIFLHVFGLLRISRWSMDGGGGVQIATDRFIKESKKKKQLKIKIVIKKGFLFNSNTWKKNKKIFSKGYKGSLMSKRHCRGKRSMVNMGQWRSEKL